MDPALKSPITGESFEKPIQHTTRRSDR